MVLASARQPHADVSAADGVVVVSALMLSASALVHLSVAPAHFAEWWVFGLLFCGAAAIQLGLAVSLVRSPSRAVVIVVLAVNVTLILIWLLSRTTGVPLGPGAGAPEAAGWLDASTTLDEAVLVILLVVGARGASTSAGRTIVLSCQAVGVTLAVGMTLAFAGGIGHA